MRLDGQLGPHCVLAFESPSGSVGIVCQFTPAKSMHRRVPTLGFSGKQRLHRSPENTCRRTRMKTERCMTQTELAERMRLNEATLERWRTESGGPLFLKLGNQVRCRLQDVEAFEEAALRGSTKPYAEVDQGVASRSKPSDASSAHAAPPRPTRPVTIWLRTGSRRTGFRPVFSGRRRCACLIQPATPKACASASCSRYTQSTMSSLGV